MLTAREHACLVVEPQLSPLGFAAVTGDAPLSQDRPDRSLKLVSRAEQGCGIVGLRGHSGAGRQQQACDTHRKRMMPSRKR